MAIEAVWEALELAGVAAQRRVDAVHPCDLYADFTPPDQRGLVAVCGRQPENIRPMRAISVECGKRSDGRWSLRLALLEPALLPVFAALCRDILAFTASGVDEDHLGGAVLSRIQRWRTLLEREAAGLDDGVLRGLIGELTVLETCVLPNCSLQEAIGAWRGPAGAPQDFLLPSGELIEVKAADRDATTVRINGLAQLDGNASKLTLAVVRVQTTGPHATGAITATRLVARLRGRLMDDADALQAFDGALAEMGWHEHPAHDELAVRILHIDSHVVAGEFPRLAPSSVPAGVSEVAYDVLLPSEPDQVWSIET